MRCFIEWQIKTKITIVLQYHQPHTMQKKTSKNYAIPLLPAVSINQTLEFYQAIGAILTYQQKAPNNYIGFKLGEIEIHFFGMKQLQPGANFSTCYLIVDKVDKLYATCREGLKTLYGKVPIKGVPRINQIKDMPTYGVRQFIMVDPSGNYIRVGQPIPKTDSVLFEENGKKPASSTPLGKAYELADRLANGKEDLSAAMREINKALAKDESAAEPVLLFKLIVLGMDVAQRMDDLAAAKQCQQQGQALLKEVGKEASLKEDIAMFKGISKALS